MSLNRMHRGLVGLSASAVAAIYIVGYVRTQSADASLGTADVPAATAVAAPPRANGGGPIVAVAVTPTPALGVATAPRGPTPAVAPTLAGQQTYKDGTYTGQGSSRRGDLSVSVVVQGGHIASATITRS